MPPSFVTFPSGPRRSTAILLALAVGYPVPAQDSAASPAERLRGCWSIAAHGQQIRFDGERCIVAHGLNQTVMSAAYPDRETVLRQVLDGDSAPRRSTVRFDGHAVELTTVRGDGPPETVRLEPIAGPDDPVPDALSLDAMPLGARDPDADEVQRIAADLIGRREREQAVRAELMELEARKRAEDPGFDTFGSPEGQAVVGRMMAIDRDNAAFVRSLLADVGWIDAGRFGADASEAAWLIVQHCGNVPMMRAVLPELREAFADGDRAAGPRYALTYDRLELKLGGLQRYGSQLGAGPDRRMAVKRLEDPANVDARRAAVGLGTLEEYVQRFGGPVALPDGYRAGGG